MTTPPTPADWYPDPENPGGLRYWDGAGWTEHRAPAPDGAEAATNADATPPVQQQPVQPYDTHPPAAESTPWNPPMPAWDPPAEPPPTQAYEAPSYEQAPPYEQAPSYEQAAPYAQTPFAPPPQPPSNKPNTKLVAGILGGAAAILVAIAVVIAFVVMRTDEPTVTSTQATSSKAPSTASSTTSSETAASPTESLTPPPPGAEGSDGDFTFSVAGTETGDTVTSNVSDAVQTTADGMFYVVYLNVGNTGAAPLTFVATFQQLSAAGQTFPLDDEATAFLGGTIAEIGPGEQKETPLVYDIPVGTEPSSILLRADPSTAGVELPLS